MNPNPRMLAQTTRAYRLSKDGPVTLADLESWLLWLKSEGVPHNASLDTSSYSVYVVTEQKEA